MKMLSICLLGLAVLSLPLLAGCDQSGSGAGNTSLNQYQPPPDDKSLNDPGTGGTVPDTNQGSNPGGGNPGGGNPGGGNTPNSPVPEPGTLVVVGLGLAAAGIASRRRRRRIAASK